MAPTFRHKCAKCETLHMGHKDICSKCERKLDQESSKRKCALCESEMYRGGTRGFTSPYCCSQCSSAVGMARVKAIKVVTKAVKTGEIKKAKECACVDCGKPAIDYDHREYLKPLNVVPVCRSCNLKRGPAIDIKESVAKNLGVSVEEIYLVIEKSKAKWQREYEQFRRSSFAKAA